MNKINMNVILLFFFWLIEKIYYLKKSSNEWHIKCDFIVIKNYKKVVQLN